jgi:hypothetical protein
MKLIKTMNSSAGRSLTVKPVDGKSTVYGGKAVRALADRYGFLQVPHRLSDFDYENGVKFLRGSFDGHTVDLEVFENGVRAYCEDGTVVCDQFIDDVILAATQVGVEFVDEAGSFIYSSALEIEFNADFGSIFQKFTAIGKLIGSTIETYGGPSDPYRGIGITMVGGLSGPQPDPFRLERRVNHAFESNVFFSTAPLTTPDHIEVLTKLEGSIV